MSRELSRLGSAIGRRARVSWRSVVWISTDPYLPLIIIGVIAAAFFFAFVLNAEASVVTGILLIGCVTAVLETKARGGRD